MSTTRICFRVFLCLCVRHGVLYRCRSRFDRRPYWFGAFIDAKGLLIRRSAPLLYNRYREDAPSLFCQPSFTSPITPPHNCTLFTAFLFPPLSLLVPPPLRLTTISPFIQALSLPIAVPLFCRPHLPGKAFPQLHAFRPCLPSRRCRYRYRRRRGLCTTIPPFIRELSLFIALSADSYWTRGVVVMPA